MDNGLTISEFLLDHLVDFRAKVTWNPASPGEKASAAMQGTMPSGGTWEEHNGGVAFLDVVRAGESLRFETWGTDTGGDYSAAAIDIFTVPIDITKPFPSALTNHEVVSPHQIWTYVFKALPENPNGFLLVAGKSASVN